MFLNYHNYQDNHEINMNEKSETNDLCRIDRRAIEALAIVPIIRAVSKRIGKESALDILRDVNQQEAFQRGRDMAKLKGNNGINELVDDVASWGDGGIWEMEVLEQTSTTYFFNVLRCPYYEKYSALGVDEFGVALSCCRDEPFARGLNPKLSLRRSQTIMEGADYCDFRYYLQS